MTHHFLSGKMLMCVKCHSKLSEGVQKRHGWQAATSKWKMFSPSYKPLPHWKRSGGKNFYVSRLYDNCDNITQSSACVVARQVLRSWWASRRWKLLDPYSSPHRAEWSPILILLLLSSFLLWLLLPYFLFNFELNSLFSPVLLALTDQTIINFSNMFLHFSHVCPSGYPHPFLILYCSVNWEIVAASVAAWSDVFLLQSVVSVCCWSKDLL